MRRKDWDNDVISNIKLEQKEEMFRERLNRQMNQQGYSAEREFDERPRFRYVLFTNRIQYRYTYILDGYAKFYLF